MRGMDQETVADQPQFRFISQGWKDYMTQLEIKAHAESDEWLRYNEVKGCKI